MSSHHWLPHERTLTGTLALTVTASYGVLMYAFPVMVVPMQEELGWSVTLLTGGFSAAAVASGVFALPVGRWIDRHGPHVVMTTGSMAALVLLLAWSRVQDPATYLLVWLGLGTCMSAVFYEPAFAVVTRELHTQRTRALSVITFAGGLASVLFVPLAHSLAAAVGWRGAVATLAVVLGVLTIPAHAFLLRPRSAGRHRVIPSLHSAASLSARDAVRTPAFRMLGTAFFLSTVANVVIAVHLVPLLMERGMTGASSAAALALLGLAKLPGRLLVEPLAARTSARTAMICILFLQITALAAFAIGRDPAVMWLFIALFGAGDGAGTPVRAELLAGLFGAREYGRIGGALAFILSLARAAAPLGGGIARTALGSYDALPVVLGLILCAAALAMGRVPCPAAGVCVLPPGSPSTSVTAVHHFRRSRP